MVSQRSTIALTEVEQWQWTKCLGHLHLQLAMWQVKLLARWQELQVARDQQEGQEKAKEKKQCQRQ